MITDNELFMKQFSQISRKKFPVGEIWLCGLCGHKPTSMTDFLKHSLEHINKGDVPT